MNEGHSSTAGPPCPIDAVCQSTAFYGRDDGLEKVLRPVDDSRLTQIWGSPGIGKTRLAAEAAQALRAEQSSPVYWVCFDGLPVAYPMPCAVARGLGLALAPTASPLDALSEFFGTQDAVLILDGCDDHPGEVAGLAEALLDNCPNLRIITTSRHPVPVEFSDVLELPPFPISDSTDDPASIALVRSAMEANGTAKPIADQTALTSELLAGLGGVPGSLVLVGHALRFTSVDQMTRSLGGRLRLLAKMDEGCDASAQKLLIAVVSWCHDLVDAEEQSAFRTLSCFAGPFSEAAGCAVAGLDGPQILSALVERGFLCEMPCLPGTSTARYMMPRAMRDYASVSLGAVMGTSGARRGHLAHYKSALATALQEHSGDGRMEDALRPLAWNIAHALMWARESEPDDYAEMVATLEPFTESEMVTTIRIAGATGSA